MSDLWLVASLLGLGAGPAVAFLARGRSRMLGFIDGFVLVAIGGLVLLEVVPKALATGDAAAGAFLLAGFLLPTMAERMLHYGVRQTHAAVLLVALVGIAIHSALDGSALAQAAAADGALLGYGVVLHQLPVSLMVWWVLADRPRAVTWGALGVMAATTVAGYMAGASILPELPAEGGAWFAALVGGSLLHVIAHPAHEHSHAHDHAHDHPHRHVHHHPHAHDDARWPNGAGALLGLVLLVVLEGSREGSGDAGSVWPTFRALALESAPAVLLAYGMAGVVHAWLPVGGLAWMSRGSRLRQGIAGMAVGLPLPICSCGVVPLYRQLIQQGASTTAAVAFLIATPELGIDAVLLSVPLLGVPYAAVRVAAAALTALLVALVVSRLVPATARGLPLAATPVAARTVGDRLRTALTTGFGSMVDNTAPWILVGLLIAALLTPMLEGSWLTTMPAGLDVLVFAAIGLPLYICASASTPLVAVFVAAGVSPGAGLALLLTGPATNVSTLGVLTRLHGRRFAIAFAVTMVACAVLLGFAINLLWPSLAETQPAVREAAEGSALQWGALVAVSGLYLASLLRRGIRGFLEELQLSEG